MKVSRVRVNANVCLVLIRMLTFTSLQAVDLNKKGKDTKQLMYRRLIHTPMEVENVQEVRGLGLRGRERSAKAEPSFTLNY